MVGDHFDESEPVPASTSPDVAGTIGDTPLDLGYTVTVDSFSGPLDLLLYLVRRTELDILEVPLSLIVDQFVDTVRSWQDADLDVAGEFILMAATLLEMKARTIAPPLEQAEEGADDEPAFDPRESLLRSLLAYRRFKEAAQGLDTLEAARRPLLERQVREHVPEAPPEEGDFDLGEIDLSLLATTCERVLSRIGGLGPRTVVVDEMPLGVRIATMLDELAVRERTTINELLAGNHSRVVHITTVMATLELTRQRFVEVEQPEQFGEIALRLRSAEERDRVPELPPPEPDGPKRRRRLPLVTFTAPESTSAATDDDTIDATPEEPAENDEQRFLRELEEATRVTAVLAITANVEKSFTEHWYTLHPELKPVAPPVPLPAPLAELAAKRIFPKRKEVPVATPAPESPAATPATETVATIVVPTEAGATTPVTDLVLAAMPLDAAASVVASPIAEAAPVGADSVALVSEAPVAVETPTLAQPLAEVIAPMAETPALEFTNVVESAPTRQLESVVQAAEAPAVPPAEITAVEAGNVAAPATNADIVVGAAGVVPTTPVETVAVAPEATTAAPAAVIANESLTADQRVLPVEEWPVMHAMPAPEEVPHPLDTLSSDDPAEVNALLAGQTSRAVARVAADDEEEEVDTDELLADDPALVNAALQADKPRAPVERRSSHDVIIPPPTETTVWTAPVDHGQTAAEVDDEAVTSPVAAEPSAVASVPTRVEIVEPTPSTEPLRLPEAATQTPALPLVASAADAEQSDDQDDMADDLVANDPALIDAVLQADAPRAAIELHPAHDLTIPTATETTVWTAPVDHGQTVAEVDDEPEERFEIAASEVVTAEVVAAVVAPVMRTPLEPVATVAPEVTTLQPAPAPELASPPALVSSPLVVEPTPTTAPLILPERVSEVPLIVVVADSAPSAVAATAAPVSTPAALVTVKPVADDPPPPEDGPPPASPPPPPPSLTRADSPLPAPATTPIPNRTMSPPPRSKAWLLIAIFLAVNAAWAGWTWFAWVPRDVLEVATTERSGVADQEVLTWRFNLDVVDALGQSKPPELVPVITPSLPGRWHWSDARTLVFEAAGPLPLATTFTATLASERFRSVQGFRLHAPAQQSWSTPALAVSSAVVETFDREGTTIALTFNQPVDPLAIAQELSLEITPAETLVAVDPVPDEEAVADLVKNLDKPAPSSEPAVTSEKPAAVSEPPVAVVSADKPVANADKPAVVAAQPAVAKPAAAQVRAISTGFASTVRLLLAAPVRGTAALRLPAGTTGVGGPLGLTQAWEQRLSLQQTLNLTQAEAVVPMHGDVRVDVAVSDPAAPRELLAPAVTVDPAVPVTISTTDAGVSLVGAFVPGQTYHIAVAATWPDEPTTSGHVLPAYTAASAVSVTIPDRPPGIWPVDHEVINGIQRFAAHGVTRADVMLLSGEDECVASREVTWTTPSDVPAVLDLDDLTLDQPAAQYRLHVSVSGEMPVYSDQTLVVEQLHVRPQALFAALTDWTIAALAGNEDADVPVRVVRVASARP